jgi:hypothetical protein
MKHIAIEEQDERVQQFLQALSNEAGGAMLVRAGQPLLRVLPAGMLSEAERDAVIARGRELVRRARERNRGMQAKEIQRKVRLAVDEVRGPEGK